MLIVNYSALSAVNNRVNYIMKNQRDARINLVKSAQKTSLKTVENTQNMQFFVGFMQQFAGMGKSIDGQKGT